MLVTIYLSQSERRPGIDCFRPAVFNEINKRLVVAYSCVCAPVCMSDSPKSF